MFLSFLTFPFYLCQYLEKNAYIIFRNIMRTYKRKTWRNLHWASVCGGFNYQRTLRTAVQFGIYRITLQWFYKRKRSLDGDYFHLFKWYTNEIDRFFQVTWRSITKLSFGLSAKQVSIRLYLPLRIPQATSLSRATIINRITLMFFCSLLEVLDRLKFEPQDMSLLQKNEPWLRFVLP